MAQQTQQSTSVNVKELTDLGLLSDMRKTKLAQTFHELCARKIAMEEQIGELQMELAKVNRSIDQFKAAFIEREQVVKEVNARINRAEAGSVKTDSVASTMTEAAVQ